MDYKDGLTGVLNKNAFIAFLSKEAATPPSEKTRFLVCANIDNMKRFNIHNGHQLGDQLLKRFVDMAVSHFPNGLVFRYGGDSFAVAISGISQTEVARLAHQLCDKAKQDLAPTQPEHCGDKFCIGPAKISVSIGIAGLHSDETAEELIRRADDLIYEAKRTGGGQVVI
jgi:diguanylate cyclase (GGDEF)-like protein